MFEINDIYDLLLLLVNNVKYFLFEPTMSTTTGLARIMIAIANTALLMEYYHRTDRYLGSASVVTFPKVNTKYLNWLVWDKWNNCNSKNFIMFGILCSISFMVGFCSNICALLLYIVSLSTYSRNYLVENAGHCQMRAMLLLMIFSRCGDALSLDAIIQNKNFIGSMGEPWCDRFMQVFIALMYYKTITYKMISGPYWWKGEVLSYALNSLEFGKWSKSFTFPRWLCIIGSYYTIATQNALVYLVWFKEFRYYVFINSMVHHLMMFVFMNLGAFPIVAISCLSVFVPSDDLAKFLSRFIQ